MITQMTTTSQTITPTLRATPKFNVSNANSNARRPDNVDRPNCAGSR